MFKLPYCMTKYFYILLGKNVVTKQEKSKSRLRKVLLIAMVLTASLMISVIGYLSNLYGHFQKDFNRLSEAMLVGDRDMVEKQMDAMIQYHNLADRWHLASFVDRHLLRDVYIYKAVTTLLKGDFRSIAEDKTLVQNASKEHLVANILGLAKARQYQGLYQEKLSQIKSKNKEPDKKDKADLDAIVKKVIEEARPYFRLAVENSPSNDLYFEYPFNYDLLQNEDSARRAMEGPGEQPGDEPLDYGDPDKNPGDSPGKKDGPKDGSDGQKPNKLNPGGQKPGGEGQPRKPKG